MRLLCGTNQSGTTIKGLAKAAEDLGFRAVPIAVELDELAKGRVNLPLICMLDSGYAISHYVVVVGIRDDGMDVLDPAVGKRRIGSDELRKTFTGKILLLAPGDGFSKESVKSGKSVVREFLGLIKGQKRYLAIAIAVGLVGTVLGIASSFFYKFLIDDILQNSLEEQLTAFFSIYLLITLANVGFSMIGTHNSMYMGKNIGIPVMLRYFGHLLRMPMEGLSSWRRGDLLTRYQDTGTIVSVITNVLMTVVVDLIFCVISGYFLYSISPQLFLITIGIVAISAVLIFVFLPAYKRLNRESMEAASELNSAIIESLGNAETIKTNGAEDRVINDMDVKLGRSVEVGMRATWISNVQGTLSGILQGVGGIVMLWVGTAAIFAGEMTLGTMLAFYSLSAFFTNPIYSLISLQIQFQEADIAQKRLTEIYAVEEERTGGGLSPETVGGEIRLEDVTFRYGEGKDVVSHLDLTIRAGEKVAIVGESGSGKSTLARMMTGLWPPAEGTVNIGGIDIRDYDLGALRHRISYVQQETQLFSGSIEKNLRLSRYDAPYEDLVEACRNAECMEFIGRMPSRLGTVLDEGGANLSGGERQRLSIARAMLKDADIMIMDEATGSLDMMTESRVLENVFRSMDGRTVVMIAHRLSAVTRCDRVIVMDRGRISEDGTHEALLSKGGLYSDLWNSQFPKGMQEPPHGDNTEDTGDDDSEPIVYRHTDAQIVRAMTMAGFRPFVAARHLFVSSGQMRRGHDRRTSSLRPASPPVPRPPI